MQNFSDMSHGVTDSTLYKMGNVFGFTNSAQTKRGSRERSIARLYGCDYGNPGDRYFLNADTRSLNFTYKVDIEWDSKSRNRKEAYNRCQEYVLMEGVYFGEQIRR